MSHPHHADAGLVVGSICTGIAGLDLALINTIGGRVAWVADPDRHIRTVLAARAPGVVNHGDITALDWGSVEPVDVVTAGFPCQDISTAGHGAGIEKGARSGLWYQVIAAVCRLRPRLVLLENVAALRYPGRGLHIVLGGLAEAGYDASWRSVRASDIGAPHRRERVFILAWPHTDRPGPVVGDPAGVLQLRRTRPQPRRPPRTPDPSGRRPPPGHPPATDPDSGGLPLLVLPVPPDDPARAGQPHPDRSRPAPPTRTRHSNTTIGGAIPAAAPRRVAGVGIGEGREVDWREYTPAIRRWESLAGRAAPYPAQVGRTGRPVLAGRFVEWLMGYPDGWVTDLDLPRTAQLHALGNAVIPAQAAHALTLLLADRNHPTPGPPSRGRPRRPTGPATPTRATPVP